MFITAHPDDETYLASGTIAENNKLGGESILVCATLGEKGKAHLSKPVTQAMLKQIREKELQSVAKLLKVKKLSVLDLKDGQLCNCGKILLKDLKTAIQKTKPEVLISFGKDGVTGHLDHIAVGEATKLIAQDLDISFVAFVAPPAYVKQVELTKQRRKHGVYKDDLLYPKPNLKIKINPELKLQALMLHASQISHQDPFHNFPKGCKQQMLNYEYFFVK